MDLTSGRLPGIASFGRRPDLEYTPSFLSSELFLSFVLILDIWNGLLSFLCPGFSGLPL